MNDKSSTGVKLLGLTAILIAMFGFVTAALSDSECNCEAANCKSCETQKGIPLNKNAPPKESKKEVPVETSKGPTRFELPGSRHFRHYHHRM
jgi:hypothetical protein